MHYVSLKFYQNLWHFENWQKILQNFRKAVFREVTHGLFTFSFSSLLAVHELQGRRASAWLHDNREPPRFPSSYWTLFGRFLCLVYILIQTFGKVWTRRSTHECTHSHSRAKIVNNKARHSRHSCFLWLGTDLTACLREFWDKTRTGSESRRRDKCTLFIRFSLKFTKILKNFHFSQNFTEISIQFL